MKKHILRIVTRKSALAQAQANSVKSQLEALYPDLRITLIGVSTTGDNLIDVPLTKIGGKGLFTKELEEYLLKNEADLAVHSMKDVPVSLPSGLEIPVLLAREDPREAFLSNDYDSFTALPEGALIGTSSLRRQLQLAFVRPDLQFKPLRGNVDTRIKKLDHGEFDAIILALAGIKRLGVEHRVTSVFDYETILPAIAQGALGLECRSEDEQTQAYIAPLNDEKTAAAILAERSMNAILGGSCDSPIAGLAQVHSDNETRFSSAQRGTCSQGREHRIQGCMIPSGLEKNGFGVSLSLIGRVFSLEGNRRLEAKATEPLKNAQKLGEIVAEQLLKQGAKEIIDRNLRCVS